MTESPLISFGIIVLNGEPFTKYCLRSLYPFAHEIIVVEGAVRGAAAMATADGHSRDGTLEALHEFKSEEDDLNKVSIIAREGFWNEKDEMSQAYAVRATGEYLWQVDIDEFYKSADIERIVAMLRDDPSISAVSFKQIQFWGGFSYFVDSWYLRMGGEVFHRVFRWGKDYQYLTHRPPTVLNEDGKDTRTLNWIDSHQMERQGIFLYHYSFVFPKQVAEKCEYYSKAEWAQRDKAIAWAENVFGRLRHPFRAHNVYEFPGWLERYSGDHPLEIENLRKDVNRGLFDLSVRPTDDIERLLHSYLYQMGRTIMKALGPKAAAYSERRRLWQRRFYRLLGDPVDSILMILRRLVRTTRNAR